MSKMRWDRVRERDRMRSAAERAPVIRDDYVDPSERKQVLAIAAAYADRNRFCRDIVAMCGTGIGRGVTRAQADAVYRISREQTTKTPRSRRGNPGAHDYQVVQDLYR